MGTQTISNGSPHTRDVSWGREVIMTVVGILGVLLVILGLIISAVVYNTQQFSKVAKEAADMNVHLERVEAKLDALAAQIALRVETADKAHAEYEKRIDGLEQWRYSQSISGWHPELRRQK